MSTKIGSFMGIDVYADSRMPEDVIEFRNGSNVIARLAIGHQYVQGTEIERVARAAVAAEKVKP